MTSASPAEPGSILAAEARKVVTVLFADLVGSTALTERLDPEEAREVVGRFYAAVQAAVEPLGGTVAKLLGDAVLAVRVGICTGEVVAASGSTFDRDFLISDAVTTAARIQQNVEPGSVVVGERTHRLTREAIEYRGLPLLEVKV